jgi:hypothetical protein
LVVEVAARDANVPFFFRNDSFFFLAGGGAIVNSAAGSKMCENGLGPSWRWAQTPIKAEVGDVMEDVGS